MAQNRLEISLKGKDLKHTQTHTKNEYKKLHASHMHTCWMETHTQTHLSFLCQPRRLSGTNANLLNHLV